jgi:hypothetical protein
MTDQLETTPSSSMAAIVAGLDPCFETKVSRVIGEQCWLFGSASVAKIGPRTLYFY